MALTFGNTGRNTSSGLLAPDPVVVTDNWTVPSGDGISNTSTFRRVGNDTTGWRVHWCLKFNSGAIFTAPGIIQSPVGHVPAEFRPTNPLGYIVLDANGESSTTTQSLRILVTNTGQIAISLANGTNMNTIWRIGGWDLSWDTKIPDV